MRISSTVAALLTATLVLAGCSDGSTSDADDPQDPPSSSSTEETPAEDPSTDETSEAPAADSSTVETDLVSFQAPEGWLVLTPDEVLAGDSDVQLDEGNELMDELGVSGEELRQLVSRADAVALDSAGRVDDFLANVNVIHQPGAGPTEAQLVGAYQGLGDPDPQVRSEQVAGVGASIVEYQIPVGDFAVEGRAVVLPVGDQTVTVTVSTREAGDSDEIFQQVLDTLQTTG